MYSIINGYGVPRDIMSDPSYHSYLGQVFNYLWERYRHEAVTLVLCGGPTDMYRPYRRTEAGEMARWLKPRLKTLGLEKRWKIVCLTKGLSAIENLCEAQRVIGKAPCLYFCEKTREKKSKVFVRKIFGSRCSVVALDFDTSPARYDTVTRKAMEQDDLKYGIKALDDVSWARKLRAANELKVRTLRRTSPEKRATEIDRIALQVRRDFLKKVRKKV